MSVTTKNFTVSKCYATKSETAKYSHILHLAVPTKIPVKDVATGKVIGYDEKVMYLRKGSSFEVAEKTVLALEIDKYNIKSFDSEWTDEETGEVRNSTEHWLSPKVAV